VIERPRVKLAPEPLAGAICERMTRLCAPLGTETAREGGRLVVELGALVPPAEAPHHRPS
jgi:hypothetical protein